MTYIFDHTDKDGDRVRVEEDSVLGTDVVLYLETLNVDDNEGVYITRSAVDRLRAALAPYGTARETKAPAVEVGKTYRLLPGAKFHAEFGDMSTGLATSGTTWVIVTHALSGRGNATVTAVDGVNAGTPNWSVAPEYLAPLDDASDAAIAAPRAKLTAPATDHATLDPLRVAAIEKALAIFGASEFTEDVSADDVLNVAAYLAGEIDIVPDVTA